MQGAQNLRREAYLEVRRNDEGEVQRGRWTFYETIKDDFFRIRHMVDAAKEAFSFGNFQNRNGLEKITSSHPIINTQ
jgi:hypothetical protein